MHIKRYFPSVVLMGIFSVGLSAQRHGRADAIQNYTRGMRVAPPEFILDLGANQKKLCFTAAGLRHMTRSTVTATDHKCRRARTFEGVDISQLILAQHEPWRGREPVTLETLRSEAEASREGSEPGVVEISFGFFGKTKIPGSELSEDSKIIIADTVDGRMLSGSAPFRLVVEARQGDIQLFTHVRRVALRSLRHQ